MADPTFEPFPWENYPSLKTKLSAGNLIAREERGERSHSEREGRENPRSNERNVHDREAWNHHNDGEVNVNGNSGNVEEVVLPPMDGTQPTGGQGGQ